MSRAQEGAVVSSAKAQNAGYYNNAQNSYSNAQADVNNYEDQLSQYKGQVAKFQSQNPYTQGGEFQTDTNRVLANTSDAAARSAGEALQAQTARTGGNTAGDVAATEKMQQQNTRTLGGEEAGAEQNRIGAEAGYNKEGLSADQSLLPATAQPAELESSLAGQQGGLAGGALSTDEKASEMPSWAEDFNNMLNKSAEQFAGGFGQGYGRAVGGG
jgi:hypothetical protein